MWRHAIRVEVVTIFRVSGAPDDGPNTIVHIQKQLTEAGVEKHQPGTPQKVLTIKFSVADINVQHRNISLTGVLYR